MATMAVAVATRRLGRSGVEVSALGLGCWAIGGPWRYDGLAAGWGEVDDAESIAAIRTALDLGVTFFDTADVYGCGRSERVLGRALAGRRDQVVIATKVGLRFDEASGEGGGADAGPGYIRAACEASLRRLGTGHIDLYQLHGGVDDAAGAERVVAVFEELVAEGKIRAYGPSIDDPAIVRVFAGAPHCVSAQHQLNVLSGNEAVLALCNAFGLASINRSPLAMGLLTGKYAPEERPDAGDVRRQTPYWDYFDDGRMESWLERIAAVREVLTAGGRTLAQGALGWIWARGESTIPIPGFKTRPQVEENVGALRFGPLRPEQMAEIDGLLGRPAT